MTCPWVSLGQCMDGLDVALRVRVRVRVRCWPRLEEHLAVPGDELALLEAEQLQRAHRRRLLAEEVRSWPLLPG